MLIETLILICLLFLAWTIWENLDSTMPPGPIRIPFLGTLVQLGLADPDGYLAMHQLSKYYGDVMRLKMGFVDAVILSSYEAIKDVFGKDEALGRHSEGMFQDRMLHIKSGIGMIFTSGQKWVENRKFCKDTLGIYGFGNRSAMEQITHEEIKHLIPFMIEDSLANNGKIHFSVFYFQFTFANLITSMLVGKRHAYEDVEIQNVLKASRKYVESGVMANGIMIAYPFLRFVFPNALGYNVQQEAMAKIMAYARNHLKQRRKLDFRTNPCSFTDEFLKKMEEEVNVSDTIFTESNFVLLFCDILQSGSDTASNALNFMVLLLTCHPQVQARLSNEIVDVCGTDRLPTLEDRAVMPYTKAVILEGLRWARIAPNGIPKKALSDFTYRNFHIKKDTVLIMNTHTSFFDEKYWGDPCVFRPERFLDETNEIIQAKAERISISFGAGKRNCFAEVMARDSLFLMLAALVQKFSFELPENQKNPCLNPLVGFTLSPHPYEATVTPRY